MKKLIATVLLFPLVIFAQDAQTITIGDQTVTYSESQSTDSATYYFADGELVASEHETSAFVYENDQAILEAHDTDGDGALDAFLTLDSTSMVTDISGPGADTFERREPAEFVGIEGGGSAAAQDLVGSLDRITVPKHGGSLWFVILFIIGALAAGWWYYKGREKEKD